MRVRIFGLRLLAAVLTALWTIAGAIVLLVYRPGGPIDGVVGLAALLPIAVSLLGLLWPPAARGDRAFAAVAWLGLGAVLLLIPSIGGVVSQLVARGPQTLLPSWEAVYPWVLALLGTALFGGLGVARRLLGSTAMRRRRLELGLVIALVATTLSGTLFAAAAIANELALRDTPTALSRFGPNDPDSEPPRCTDPVTTGAYAVVSLTIRGDVDGRPTGTINVHGIRSGNDVSWTADVATDAAIGQFALVRLGGTTWTRLPRDDWQVTPVDPAAAAAPAPSASKPAGAVPPTAAPQILVSGTPFPPLARPALDDEILTTALTIGYRSAAEDRGLEFVEGARARHCRVALDGRTFQGAFPAVGWISATEDLHRWRGALDYWIFLDGQIGQVSASVNGEASSLGQVGLQANLYADLTATDRGTPVTITAPQT